MSHFTPHTQSVWRQSYGQHQNSKEPNEPVTMSLTNPTSPSYINGLNHSIYQNAKDMMPTIDPSASGMPQTFTLTNHPPALSSDFSFPGPPVDLPQTGQSMSSYSIHQPAGYYSGSYTTATNAEPSSSFVDWTAPTYTQLPQIGNTGTTDMLSPNGQEHMGPTFLQSPFPVTSNKTPYIQRPPSSDTTDDAMDSTCFINGFTAPNRMQAPPPGSRLNHISDPEVHEAYRGVRLQAMLKNPMDQQPTAPVTIRREKKVVLELTLHSDFHPISGWGWEGIRLPQTGSVKSVEQIFPEKLLNLSIQVFGPSTGAPNAQPCRNCWDRERQSINPNVFLANPQPYMIDFKAENITTALSASSDKTCLKAEVTFHFTCYSKHHGVGRGYRLIVKLHDKPGHLVAHRRLPYEFIVKANGNGGSDGKLRAQRPARQRAIRPALNPPSASVLETQSPEPPASFYPVSLDQHSQLNSAHIMPALRKLAPADGPVSGGPTILISGINFPPPTQLIIYARFGTIVVPTSWQNPYTLECKLPPSPTSGIVEVTLSLYQEPGKPQFGQGRCWFKYNPEHDHFYTLLRTIVGQKHDVTPETWDSMIPHVLQNVSPAGLAFLHQAIQPSQPTGQFFGPGEVERLMLQFLTSLSNSPGWDNTISLVNEYHQTLAHLAVLFRYTTLLEKVMQWGIDVDVQDVNGFTALHCAYLCGDLDSVRILQSYGADEDIEDVLSRRPLDMYITNTNGPGTESPSSDRTPSSGEVLSAGEEDWEKVSIADHETTTDLPASEHQQLHAYESTTSFGILPALLSKSSPICDNVTDDGGEISGANEPKLTNSPITLEHSPPSVHVPDIPPATLEYTRNHEQEPEEVETRPIWFLEGFFDDMQSMFSRQTESNSRRNSQNAGSDRDGPDLSTNHTRLPATNFARRLHSELGELGELEDVINKSDWLANNSHEPLVGDPDCPPLAEMYGIRRRSCYTAFVRVEIDDSFGCRFDCCYSFRTTSLEDAIRHQRHHHFNHCPYECIPAGGFQCGRRFFAEVDLTNHQQHCQ